jgi:hypothetical protein
VNTSITNFKPLIAPSLKQHVIVDFEFNDEEQAAWTEGEGWLDDLIALQEELIQDDFRVLYLAWLKAAALAVEIEDIADDTIEQPVPAGLGQLSPALAAFVRFLDIDAALLNPLRRQRLVLTDSPAPAS